MSVYFVGLIGPVTTAPSNTITLPEEVRANDLIIWHLAPLVGRDLTAWKRDLGVRVLVDSDGNAAGTVLMRVPNPVPSSVTFDYETGSLEYYVGAIYRGIYPNAEVAVIEDGGSNLTFGTLTQDFEQDPSNVTIVRSVITGDVEASDPLSLSMAEDSGVTTRNLSAFSTTGSLQHLSYLGEQTTTATNTVINLPTLPLNIAGGSADNTQCVSIILPDSQNAWIPPVAINASETVSSTGTGLDIAGYDYSVQRTLQNLLPGKRYSVRVRAYNNFNIKSDWSEALEFTTLATEGEEPVPATGGSVIYGFSTGSCSPSDGVIEGFTQWGSGIDSYGSVILPAGTYQITTTIILYRESGSE